MLDFPASPVLNQQFSAANSSWVWDGTAWNIVPQMVPAVASDTPPANPAVGQFWWRSSNGQLYVFYVDPSGPPGQWVQAVAPAQAPVTPARAWELIGDYTLNTAAQQDVLNLGAFRKLRISGMLSGTAASGIGLRTSTNNGTSFDSGATDYTYQTILSSGTGVAAISGNTTALPLSGGATPDVGTMVNFEGIIESFNVAIGCRFSHSGSITASAVFNQSRTASFRGQTTARNAIRFLPPGGGTLTGTVTVEGVRG